MSYCAPCAAAANRAPSPKSAKQIAALVKKQQKLVPRADCTYSLETLYEYKNYLNCVKQKNIFDLYDINYIKVNSHIGIVQSAINYNTNPCYFEAHLDEITIFINKVKESNQCQFD